MGYTVNMNYQRDTGDLSVTCSGRTFDVSGLSNLSIEQWGFPFACNGVRWRGLYEELKAFVGSESFILQFEGDDTSFEILQYLFRDKPVSVLRQADNIEVVLVYSEDPFTTRIMIDGKAFDTTKIQNRSIDEWIFPINTRGVTWRGIFAELESYLHSTVYTILFVGRLKDMEFLLQYCPDTVSVFYRDPKVVQMTYQADSARTQETQGVPEGNTAGRTAAKRRFGGTPFTRVREHKVFSGICSGLAKRMEIKPWAVRTVGIIFMVGLWFVFVVIEAILETYYPLMTGSALRIPFFINIGICLVYIILTFLVPLEGMDVPFVRIRENKVLAGVCSGLAVRMAVRPWVVRLVGIVCMAVLPFIVNLFLAMLVIDAVVCVAYAVLIFVTPLVDRIG